MNGYENGKIYKVINENDDIIYIGSTKQTLKRRWGYHKLKCDEYKIVLIENYACENRTELRKMEQKFIDLYKEMGLLNECKAYRTKEEEKEYNKEYQKSDKSKAYKKKYKKNDKNKQHIKEYQKEYQKNDKNKQHIKEYQKEYQKEYKKNDTYKQYQKQYRETNKIKENCPYCEKLMLKNSIKNHIKTACKNKDNI